MVSHPIPPLYNHDSEILILGSFPSIKSREGAFFYNHPQNRFWYVLSHILNTPLPISIKEKREFILNNKIALWDVIKSCDIVNSSDSSIKNITTNDIDFILKSSNVKMIFTNGAKASELYKKYIYPKVNIKAICLPSTSPANAKYTLDKLYEEWSIIKAYLFQENS